MLLYSAVHIETRYISAFAAVLLLTAYTAIHVPGKRLAAGIAVVGLLWSLCLLMDAPRWGEVRATCAWQSTPSECFVAGCDGFAETGPACER